MTLDQIRAFQVLAEQLNYTKASQILFVSQSNLSRIITSLETELNMQLLIRDSHSVRLTPAGIVLYQELSRAYDIIQNAIQKAKDTNAGITKTIHVGVLDGTYINDFMPELIQHFKNQFPNIRITLAHYSFQQLTEKLYDGSIDVAFTLEFNFHDYPDFIYEPLEASADNLVIHKSSPLFQKETVTLEDMDGQDLIIISQQDLAVTTQQVLQQFQKLQIAPIYQYAPDLDTAMLWLESGLGAAFLFSRNRLSHSEDLRFIELDSPWKTDFILGWNKNNRDPTLALLIEYTVSLFH